MIKTTGDVFKKFWDDYAWWYDRAVDDIAGTIDGTAFDVDSMYFSDLKDSNEIILTSGFVYYGSFESSNCETVNIGEFFSRWEKKEHDKQFIPPITLAISHTFTVTIPHENSEIFLQMVKNVEERYHEHF